MYSGKKILALITARGGSKGIPGKNIVDLGGRPLISWTIEAGLGSRYIDRLILSSEDERIITIAKQYGCQVPFIRPMHLAKDDTPSMDVILHAMESIEEKFDYLVLLQPTSPFRTAKHIDEILEYTIEQDAKMVVSVSRVKKSPTLMFYKDQRDQLTPVIEAEDVTRRQDAKVVYEYDGAIYVSCIEFLTSVKSYKTSGVLGFELNEFWNIDIDEFDDLEYARYIVNNKL